MLKTYLDIMGLGGTSEDSEDAIGFNNTLGLALSEQATSQYLVKYVQDFIDSSLQRDLRNHRKTRICNRYM